MNLSHEVRLASSKLFNTDPDHRSPVRQADCACRAKWLELLIGTG